MIFNSNSQSVVQGSYTHSRSLWDKTISEQCYLLSPSLFLLTMHRNFPEVTWGDIASDWVQKQMRIQVFSLHRDLKPGHTHPRSLIPSHAHHALQTLWARGPLWCPSMLLLCYSPVWAALLLPPVGQERHPAQPASLSSTLLETSSLPSFLPTHKPVGIS